MLEKSWKIKGKSYSVASVIVGGRHFLWRPDSCEHLLLEAVPRHPFSFRSTSLLSFKSALFVPISLCFVSNYSAHYDVVVNFSLTLPNTERWMSKSAGKTILTLSPRISAVYVKVARGGIRTRVRETMQDFSNTYHPLLLRANCYSSIIVW